MTELENNKTSEAEIDNSENQKKRSKSDMITYMFWLFTVGNVAGVIIEGIVNFIAHGSWETHVTLLWGPFNLVYGFACVFIYLMTLILKDRSTLFRFFVFSVVCTSLEATVAIFQRKVFNSESWDYSEMPFNFLGGKICLPFSLLWGFIGIAFSHYLFGPIDSMFDKGNTNKYFKRVSATLAVLTAVNIIFSTAVLYRWGNRSISPDPKNNFEIFVDKKYTNEYMQHRFCEWHIFTPEELNT